MNLIKLSKYVATGALTSSLMLAVPAAGQTQSLFEQKCNEASVIKCDGFESPETLAYVTQSHPVQTFGLDTEIVASGSSSLKFEIPSQSTSNGGGTWAAPLGDNFLENDSFYVSFKQRFSPEMFSDEFKAMNTSWKQAIFHAEGGSCSTVELTTVNTFWRGFPEMYTKCGARSLQVNMGGGDYLLQQGDYNCRYQDRNVEDCSFYRVNQWMTFYYEISIGTWGVENSSVKAYVSYEGGPLLQFIDMQNYRLDGLEDLSRGYDSILLGPYMTRKEASISHPAAKTWYDDLIISRAPIWQPYDVPYDSSGAKSDPPAGLGASE